MKPRGIICVCHTWLCDIWTLGEGGQKTRDITTCDFTFVVLLLAQRGFNVPILASIHGFARHRPHRRCQERHSLGREAPNGVVIAHNTSELMALSTTAAALPQATNSTTLPLVAGAAGGKGKTNSATVAPLAEWVCIN